MTKEELMVQIELARDMLRIPAKELSLRAGLAANTYDFYRRGERVPKLETVVKLAEVIGWEVEFTLKPKKVKKPR